LKVFVQSSVGEQRSSPAVRQLKFPAKSIGPWVSSPSGHLDRVRSDSLRASLHRGIAVRAQQHSTRCAAFSTCFLAGSCSIHNGNYGAHFLSFTDLLLSNLFLKRNKLQSNYYLSKLFQMVILSCWYIREINCNRINFFLCFLNFQKHDRKTHRLWFLWPPALTKVPPEVAGKCGCVGGCSFFGANCNGRNFFKPSRVDVDDRCNVAIPTIKDRREKPAYGQSILYDNVLVTADCKWFR